MPRTAEYIRKISLKDKYENFFVRKESVKIECILVQETDWLFVFKALKEYKENDRRKFCISKIDYYLNSAIIQGIS